MEQLIADLLAHPKVLETRDHMHHSIPKHAHLLRSEKTRGMTWFELAHDRLVGPIVRSNVEWVRANVSTFQEQAALWVHRGRPDEM